MPTNPFPRHGMGADPRVAMQPHRSGTTRMTPLQHWIRATSGHRQMTTPSHLPAGIVQFALGFPGGVQTFLMALRPPYDLRSGFDCSGTREADYSRPVGGDVPNSDHKLHGNRQRRRCIQLPGCGNVPLRPVMTPCRGDPSSRWICAWPRVSGVREGWNLHLIFQRLTCRIRTNFGSNFHKTILGSRS